MDILLQRLDAVWDWQPMKRLVGAWKGHRPESLLLVVPPLQSEAAARRLGSSSVVPPMDSEAPAIGAGLFLDDGAAFGVHGAALEGLLSVARRLPRGVGSRLLPASLAPSSATELFVLEQEMQPRVLLLGAGADALPVAQLSAFLGWSVTVVDHRSHFAQAARFPQAEAVLDGGPQAVPRLLQAGCSPAGHFDAAIVMSHHLLTDAAYLRALVLSNIPYIGLLGPIVRRERLLAELGAEAVRLRGRLRAPVGLDLGAASPEAIALSIVAEIQAVLSGTDRIASLSDKSANAGAAVSAVALEEPR